jgi:hypothetical protein
MTVPKMQAMLVYPRILTGLLALSLIACSAATKSSQPHRHFVIAPRLEGNHYVGEIEDGLGIACYFDGAVGPASYAVRDIGKNHVPRPRAGDLATLHHILKYTASRTLRFVYLENEFVVFNAPSATLCDPDVPPVPVLNGACNEFYSSLDLYSTTAGTMCSKQPPWATHKRSKRKASG